MDGGEAVVMEPEDQMDFKYEDFSYGTAFSPTPPVNDTTIDPLVQNETSEAEHPVESDQQTNGVVNVGELFVGRLEFEEICKELRELKEEVTRLRRTNEQNCPSKSVQTDNPHKKNARGQSLETPPKDALMTPSILKEVFSYLNFRGLKSARLVCTTWAEASSPRFLAKARMRVYLMNIFDRAMCHFEGAFPPDLDPQHTFKSLIVDDMYVFSGMMRREWMASYGKSLTHLQLGCRIRDNSRGCEDRLPSVSKEDLLYVFKLCTNLTELVLPFPCIEIQLGPREWDCPSVPGPFQRRRLQLLQLGDGRAPTQIPYNFDFVLKMVFETLASLKTLRLESRSEVRLKRFFKWLEGSPRAKKVLEGLEELDISKWRTSSGLLQGLAKVKFQNLKILHLGNRLLPNEEEAALAKSTFDLLAAVSSTLEELTLHSTERCLPLKIALPDLPKLRTFRNCELALWALESMDFVLKTPKLELLGLTSYKSDPSGKHYFPRITSGRKPHPQLKTLRLDFEARPEEFELIGGCFPNLEKVVFSHLGTSRGRGVRACLIGLTNLEHLKVLDLTILFCRWEEPSEEDCDLKSVATALPNFPALEIVTFGSNRPLTGEMFTHGFFKCPKLKRLDVSREELSPDEDWDPILKSGHRLEIIVPGWINKPAHVANVVNVAAASDGSDDEGDW